MTEITVRDLTSSELDQAILDRRPMSLRELQTDQFMCWARCDQPEINDEDYKAAQKLLETEDRASGWSPIRLTEFLP